MKWKFLACQTIPYSEAWYQRLQASTFLSGHELNLLDTAYGLHVGNLVQHFCDQEGIIPEYIGWHGHTIFHDPDQNSTCQIGQGGAVAGISGIPTITQFRQIDLALGGQGAPLAPIADIMLMEPADFYINLGGISNISFYDDQKKMRSFDVGPCNQLLNRLAKQLGHEYDPEGQLAASGKINPDLFKSLNEPGYFDKPYPKSIDNNWIWQEVWPRIEKTNCNVLDKLCTVSHHIAHQLALVIKEHSQKKHANPKILISGGGAHNDFILALLGHYLGEGNHVIYKPDTDKINFKEAALMGLMAFLFVNGQESVLSEVTGSKSSHIGGCFYQAPGNYKKIHG